jgi:hypothetical protein
LIADLSGKIAASTAKSGKIIKSIPVVIGTIDSEYTGNIVRFSFERLLDILNRGSVGDQPELPFEYLQLHNAEICPFDLQNTTSSANCIIAKSGILFVGEKMITENENYFDLNRSSLFMPKKAICVEIRLPSLLIIGQIYIELWQRLIGAFSDDRRFLPVTSALLSRPNGQRARFEFVAVNRNQINSITQKE